MLTRAVKDGHPGALDDYSPRALARGWKAQDGSYWMTTMPHTLPGTTPFDLRRQLGELAAVNGSAAGVSLPSPRPTSAGPAH